MMELLSDLVGLGELDASIEGRPLARRTREEEGASWCGAITGLLIEAVDQQRRGTDGTVVAVSHTSSQVSID